jgi:hypothetical protein
MLLQGDTLFVAMTTRLTELAHCADATSAPQMLGPLTTAPLTLLAANDRLLIFDQGVIWDRAQQRLLQFDSGTSLALTGNYLMVASGSQVTTYDTTKLGH